MQIELSVSKEICRNPTINIEGEEIENLLDALFKIGRILSHYYDDIEFIVKIYQDKILPVSLDVDLVVFLEQMLNFVKWITEEYKDRELFILSFYEQGIEVDIEFNIKKEKNYYRFFDGNEYNECFNFLDLKKDIQIFYQNLYFCIDVLIPDLLKFEELKEWLQTMKNQFKL